MACSADCHSRHCNSYLARWWATRLSCSRRTHLCPLPVLDLVFFCLLARHGFLQHSCLALYDVVQRVS